jgi:hypothetical protein
MWRFALIVIWLIASSVIKQNSSRPVFGVRVSIGANSQINHYVAYLDNGRVLTNKRVMDEQTFIKVVSGEWPSLYNPKRINFFEENKINQGTFVDSLTLKEVFYCEPFDSLWKIRFATYPFQHTIDMGWSNKYFKPSPKQEKYLYDRYGVESVDANFFMDTSFWLLLQDVQDSSWISNYKSLE